MDYLIVDVRDNEIAFFDLNKSIVKRKGRSDTPQRPATQRHQSKPEHMDLVDFIESIEHYQYEVSGHEYQNGVYLPSGKSAAKKAEIKEERVAQAQSNYELIRPIVEDESKRFEYLYRKSGNQIIVERSKETGIKAEQISRLLCQYFRRGGCLNAMFPNYRYCGSSFVLPATVSDIVSKKGRKSAHTNFRARTAYDDALIEKHLKKLGRKKYNKYPHTKMYQIFDFYYQTKEEVVINELGEKSVVRVPLPESECISYDQYYAYVRTLEKNNQLHWLNKGEKQYLQEFEGRLGRARDGVKGPGFRYEVDATIEDVYLLFPYFTEYRLSSGRPTTYRVMDTFSGMVVGFHVGIGGPNWQGVLQALYNAFSDKVEFCKRYGIDISPEDWPCFHVCCELTIDNGVEYPSKNMKQLLDEEFGISCVNYTQIYSGNRKGTVEGGFKQDKNDVVQFLPGYVERIPEKGEKHASNLAVYTQDKFIQLLIVNTLIRNNEIFNARLHDKAMSERGVGATCREVWNFGLKYYMNGGRGMVRPQEEILYKLLPSAMATTTAKGIKYNNVLYNCPFAASQGWLTDSANRKVKKLEIRYFDGSTMRIWYRWEGVIYTAELNQSQSAAFENKSWFDALHRMEIYSKERAEQKRKEREARIAQMQFTKEKEQEAMKQLEGTHIPQRNSPNSLTKITALITKRIQDHKTSNLFTQLLGSEERAKDTTIRISTKHKSTNNQFLKMYGESDGN
ncbi:hypothetical protein [Flavobacterium sp.]|uniref:hypothetical protein n=1 Tax=Flavobacterium sp. TaxID=239 RepID=UPI0026093BEF|nr:hypothetical protein [Flavobacterium sp.]